jgi:Ca2+-binding RTX toxin-like protein
MARLFLCAVALTLGAVSLALAKADHSAWPKINGHIRKAKHGHSKTYRGTRRNDELLGHHGSDRIYGKAGSDVLWGDWEGNGQPTTQRDLISGGGGSDFIYSSHGYNTILGGPGNDAISAHYGRGTIDCGPGNDIYHVPKSLKKAYKVRNCEKVDRRSESQRGGLRPLP